MTEVKQSKADEARDFAVKNHLPMQKYDDMDYSYHLAQVCKTIKRICNLCFVEALVTEELICAGWLHDVLEDSSVNYNDIKKIFGVFVAELVYGCTSEKGRTRKERFSDKFYAELREIPYAFFIKACDRLANMEHSKARGSSMYGKYKAELPLFLEKGTPTNMSEQEQVLVDEITRLLLEV
jgi:(p)ppGpp synthase/HD superfamily hydrolase